jgi:CRP-like cAMP-binding protein
VSSSLLERLSADDRVRLLDELRRRTFAAGAEIVREGEMTSDFFVILAGSVEVIRGGERIAVLGEGDCFGEMAALDPGPGYALARNATVRALEPVQVGVLDEPAFAALLRSAPAVRGVIHATISQRERAE